MALTATFTMGFIFNALKRLIKTIIKLSLVLALIATVIILIPNLPPYTKFSSIDVSPVQPRVGPLAINSALNNAGRLYDGKLIGPEAFQVFKGELYTSLATGEIVKLSPEGHVTFVTTVGQPCTGTIQEHICGRPLGFVIDEKDETLYVADAYHGIWKVNLKTNKKQLLVSSSVKIEKRQPKLFNCLQLAKNGDLYWTDSTSDFNLKDGAISMMTDPSGRLFHYDAAKNQSKVLLDDLWFPNGVALSPNNDFVVVAETIRSRMMKYYISGPKKGQKEVFADGLPGVPDNLRALPDGSGVLVALYNAFEPERPPVTQLLAATPLVRKLLARLQRLVEIPFEYLNTIYPNIVFEEIVYFVGHFKSVSGLTPPLSGLLQVDWNGNIVAGYYNTDKTLAHISDAIVFNNKLYTGSPHQEFVGAVPVPPLLKKAFESSKKADAKVEKSEQNAKPVQQAPVKKTEEKPKAKVEEKPKAETKPKVETPKPAEQKKEAPKVVKPAAAAPKPPQEAKPAATKPKVEAKPQETPKAAPPTPKAPQPTPKPPQQAPKAPQPTPKPPQQAPEPPKQAAQPPKQAAQPPQQAPKAPSPTKPAPTAATPEPVKAPTKTEPKPAASKPEVKTTPPPKPAEKASPPPPPKAQTETKKEAPKKAQPAAKQDAPKSAEIKPKPIKEEIPSDTAKPAKETLKVIKRDGPAEIHVPNQ
ncbi:hypothetical protein PYW07_007851 [Mythimna separata]|uniref:Strictosidine synthase conserved region domain-containing protein n=1 Tax=Mythimna separata TaxID=271217 RepID=A0AAD8DU55_MYTSE|nr:hypothetical protein PYW07_007851 [Mythimna separata]